jgi:4'-phosphopantetheinyl transferase
MGGGRTCQQIAACVDPIGLTKLFLAPTGALRRLTETEFYTEHMNSPGMDVHLWHIRLDEDHAAIESLQASLDPIELERGRRFRTDDLRRRFTITHGSLRQILATYLGAQPAEIQYSLGKHGKPEISFPRTSLRFNLSHSGELAAVGIATCDIGVDVEHMRPIPEMMSLARSFFSLKEILELERLPECERAGAFYRIWTRKEAHVKCVGEGLSVPLDSFCVSSDQEARFVELGRSAQAASKWQLHGYDPKPGYTGAVAYAGVRRKLQVFDWASMAGTVSV